MHANKRVISIKLAEERFLAIQKLARNLQLSMTDFIQMKCLDLKFEDKVVLVKTKRILVEKTTGFHCPRCDRYLSEEEKSSPEGILCYNCEVEMDKNMEDAQEQPF